MTGVPDERFGIVIMFADSAVDGSVQLDNGKKDEILLAPAGQLGKEALDGTARRAGGWDKVEGPSRTPVTDTCPAMF